jgi:hypothetical protein
MRTKYFLAFDQSAYGGHKVRDKKLAFLAFGEVKKIGKTKVYTSYNFILLFMGLFAPRTINFSTKK